MERDFARKPDTVRNTYSVVSISTQEQPCLPGREFFDCLLSDFVTYRILRHGAGPAIDGGKHGLAGDSHEPGVFAPDERDELFVVLMHEVQGVGSNDEGAESDAIVWCARREFGADPGGCGNSVTLAFGYQESKSVQRMAERLAFIYQGHEERRGIGD